MKKLLFLNQGLYKKTQMVLNFLVKNNEGLFEKANRSLEEAENQFVKKLQKKNPNLLFELKKFLQKKKVIKIKNFEDKEKQQALGELDKLIDNL